MRRAAVCRPPQGALSDSAVFTREFITSARRSIMRFRQVQFCSGFLLLLVCAATALGQNATGSITGTVTDPNNDVVANATITVTNKATGAVRKVNTRSGG